MIENDDLGESVLIGELAHNVGWGDQSPRGDSVLSDEERRSAENLILACRDCHKPIDAAGVVGRYSVNELMKRKQEHEERVRLLTEIGADRSAYLVRMVGMIRGTAPELSRETVLAAATSAGLYPKRLPGAYWEDVDLDLRSHGEPKTKQDFEAGIPAIRELAARVHDGVRRDDVQRVAVFGLARIPWLISLGAHLDDKVRTSLFQRHRRDDVNAWGWPDDLGPPNTFKVTRQESAGDDSDEICLLASLSGTIKIEELPDHVRETSVVYHLAPTLPDATGPAVINSIESLQVFEGTVRRFLATVEERHGKIPHIHLFPAVPVTPAITLGRVLMPDVSPAWRVYDRDENNVFIETIEVSA